MNHSITFLLVLLLGIFQATVALPSPQVSLTVNVTSVSVGSPVRLHCSVAHFSPKLSTGFDINFYEPSHDHRHYFAYYFIDKQGNVTFKNEVNIPDLTRRPVSSTFPDYEITVIPGTSGLRNYTCQLLSFFWSVTSGSVRVKVTP